MKYAPCKIPSIYDPKYKKTVVASGPPQYDSDYYPFAVETCGGPFVVYQFQQPVFNLLVPKWRRGTILYSGYNGTIIIDGVIHTHVGGTYAGTLPSCP